MVPIYGSHYISVVRCCYRIQIRTIPPKGWGGWRLSTRVRASSVECCSQDSISTCPIYPSELQQPKKTLRVAGTCHWKPSASSRASRVEGVSTGPTTWYSALQSSENTCVLSQCPNLSPPNWTTQFLCVLLRKHAPCPPSFWVAFSKYIPIGHCPFHRVLIEIVYHSRKPLSLPTSGTPLRFW